MNITWRLVGSDGLIHPLPPTMIFIGREDCDINLKIPVVDRRHAVITYDHYERKFKIKDLNTLNGTYINEERCGSQKYQLLSHGDILRFGFGEDVDQFRIELVTNSKELLSPSEFNLPTWASRSALCKTHRLAECSVVPTD